LAPSTTHNALVHRRPHKAPINDYTTHKRIGRMTFMRVTQGATPAITIPIYRVNTPNILLLSTVRWTPVIVIIVPCHTPKALKSFINKGL